MATVPNTPANAPAPKTVEVKNGSPNLDEYNTALQVNTDGGDAANVNLVEGKEEPKQGDTVYITAVHGLIVDPTPPVTEIPQGKGVKVKFNKWHSLQWQAGKITSDE